MEITFVSSKISLLTLLPTPFSVTQPFSATQRSLLCGPAWHYVAFLLPGGSFAYCTCVMLVPFIPRIGQVKILSPNSLYFNWIQQAVQKTTNAFLPANAFLVKYMPLLLWTPALTVVYQILSLQISLLGSTFNILPFQPSLRKGDCVAPEMYGLSFALLIVTSWTMKTLDILLENIIKQTVKGTKLSGLAPAERSHVTSLSGLWISDRFLIVSVDSSCHWQLG